MLHSPASKVCKKKNAVQSDSFDLLNRFIKEASREVTKESTRRALSNVGKINIEQKTKKIVRVRDIFHWMNRVQHYRRDKNCNE